MSEIEYRGYGLKVEPWTELFFSGFVCWILWGCGTVAKTFGFTREEAMLKARARIDHWTGGAM